MVKWTHKPTWADSNHQTDRVILREGVCVARTYQFLRGPSQGRWGWFMQGGRRNTGTEETLQKALCAVRDGFYARHYVEIGFPRQAASVGNMAATQTPVKGSCCKCKLDTKVDLTTLIKCNGSNYSLIDKRGHCRRYGCDGRVRFFYKDGHENWHPLQTIKLCCDGCCINLHHTLSDVAQIYGSGVHPDNLLARVRRRHGCVESLLNCKLSAYRNLDI